MERESEALDDIADQLIRASKDFNETIVDYKDVGIYLLVAASRKIKENKRDKKPWLSLAHDRFMHRPQEILQPSSTQITRSFCN